MLDITYGGAALAGLLSFLSPCILPMVPFYLSYMAGISVRELRDGGEVAPGARLRMVLRALAFATLRATVGIVGVGDKCRLRHACTSSQDTLRPAILGRAWGFRGFLWGVLERYEVGKGAAILSLRRFHPYDTPIIAHHPHRRTRHRVLRRVLSTTNYCCHSAVALRRANDLRFWGNQDSVSLFACAGLEARPQKTLVLLLTSTP